VEEVVAKVMKANKALSYFKPWQLIMSLNMGNLTLEVNTLKNIFGCRGEGTSNVTGGIR
jgi:hypothetical protein